MSPLLPHVLVWAASMASPPSDGAGTYAPIGTSTTRQLVAPGGSGSASSSACHVLEPSAQFEVAGPAQLSMSLWLDLPKRPPKPGPVRIGWAVDGSEQSKLVRPVRSRWSYEAQGALPPSLPPSVPLHLELVPLGAGAHSLRVSLPAGRTGCLVFGGVRARDAGAAKSPLVEAGRHQLAEVARQQQTAGHPPLERIDGAGDDGDEAIAAAERIDAVEVGSDADLTTRAGSSDETATRAPRDEAEPRIRLGLYAGAVVPLGQLRNAWIVGATLEVPLAGLGAPWSETLAQAGLDLALLVDAAFVPLRQQDGVLVPGRGAGGLIQESATYRLDAGLEGRVRASDTVRVIASVGPAFELVRTELRIFSLEPERTSDAGLGWFVSGGASARIAVGELVVGVRGRFIGADVGSLDGVAEDRLSALDVTLGLRAEF